MRGVNLPKMIEMMHANRKATVSLTFETILKMVLILAFILAMILLMMRLQGISLERLSLIDPLSFFKNLISGT